MTAHTSIFGWHAETITCLRFSKGNRFHGSESVQSIGTLVVHCDRRGEQRRMMLRLHRGRTSRSRRSESLENKWWRGGRKRDGALPDRRRGHRRTESGGADGSWRERDRRGRHVGTEEEREDEGCVRAGGSEEEEEEKPSEAVVWKWG